jgi:hypothetical protein
MPTRFSGLRVFFTVSCVAALLAGASMLGVFAASEANVAKRASSANSTSSQDESTQDANQKTETGKDAAKKNLGEHYGLLQTNRAKTMERELNATGSAGYRVVDAGTPGFVEGWFFGVTGEAIAFLLEKSEPPQKYEYRIWDDGGSISMNGVGNKMARKLSDRLNQEATAGFRLLPACTFARQSPAFLAQAGGSNIICMERHSSLPSRHYEYQVVHDGGLKKLHEKVEPLLQQGYAIVALDEATANFAVLERPADGDPRPTAAPNHAQPYLVLGTNRVSSMRNDINEKAKAHYRLRDVCFAYSAHRVIMQKEDNPTGIYEYETVSFGDKLFEQKIAENGKHGFRAYPRNLGTDLIMEKSPGPQSQYRYVLAQGKTLQEVFAQVDSGKQQGFKLFGMVSGGILLESTASAQEPAAPPAATLRTVGS